MWPTVAKSQLPCGVAALAKIMKVIITGIAGFIGSHVADEMLRLGWEVAGIDNLSGGFAGNIPSEVKFFERDCCSNLDDIFQEISPDAVVHLAAYAAEGLSHHIPTFNYHNNLISTANVLTTAHRAGAKQFAFSSSIAVYGHPLAAEPLTEETRCWPCDPYGIAKLACEQHIAAFHNYYGSPTYTIFRPHNVFGPRQNISDPFRNVVGIFFRCAKLGLPFPIFGDGSQTRSFSYIDVVAKCIASCFTTPYAANQIFNIGGERSLTVIELAQMVANLTQTTTGIEYLPSRNEVQHAHALHSKARQVFPTAFENAISVEAGLKLMLEHLDGRMVPMPTACPSAIEIFERLPSKWQSEVEVEVEVSSAD
jgi:UDP-glucose 4-epimerase